MLRELREEEARNHEIHNEMVIKHMGLKSDHQEAKETLVEREREIEALEKKNEGLQHEVEQKEGEVVNGRREIAHLKEDITDVRGKLLFFTSKRFTDQITDTKELDALVMTPRGGRVERIMATTPSSRTASRNRKMVKNTAT